MIKVQFYKIMIQLGIFIVIFNQYPTFGNYFYAHFDYF